MAIGAVLAGAGGLLGGLSSLLDSGGNTTTVNQQMIPTRPAFTPEEEALRNYYLDIIFEQVNQDPSILESALTSWLTGGAIDWKSAISPYLPTQEELTPYAGLVPTTAKEYEKYTGQGLPADILKQQYEYEAKPDFLKLSDSEKAKKAYEIAKNKESKGWLTGTPYPDLLKKAGFSASEITKYNALAPWRIDEIKRLSGLPSKPDLSPLETYLGEHGMPETKTPTAEEINQDVLSSITWQDLIPETSALGQIMRQTPEQISGEFDILRQQGMKGIGDWYDQAAREMEQRGITQSGGLMGSRTEKDLGAILGRRGELEKDLTQTLGLQEMQAKQQQPYSVLQAVEDLRRWEASNTLAQESQWINQGANLISNPWGQTNISSTTSPGVGIIPGAISGATTAMGMYGMGQNLGWWGNQPATSYGMGLSGVSPMPTWGNYTSGVPGSPYLGPRMA